MKSEGSSWAIWSAWAILSLRRGAWAPVLVFSIHVVGVFSINIYSLFPDFDIPMHFAGGVAIAYFFGQCYRAAARCGLLGQPSALLFPPMIVGLTALAAVLWEFAEFVADRCFGTHSQPSLEDTLLDLAMGVLGGLVMAACSRKSGSLETSENDRTTNDVDTNGVSR